MKRVTTRVEDDLHAKVKRLAEIEGRSMNALVIDAVTTFLGTDPVLRSDEEV